MRGRLFIGFWVVSLCAGFAQAPTPSFEVASVKYDPRKAGSWVRFEGGRLEASSWLKQLIQVAYDVNDYQISGGPGWLTGDWYAIQATAPDGSASQPQMKLMLRALLADRFKLRMREESKEFDVLNLAAAKGGPKLRALKEGEKSACTGDNSQLCGMKTTAALARFLTNVTRRPVFDKTAVSGNYDILLNFDTYSARGATPPPGSDLPDLTTALREQLGMRLEPAKEQIPVLLIESVQRPSEN